MIRKKLPWLQLRTLFWERKGFDLRTAYFRAVRDWNELPKERM